MVFVHKQFDVGPVVRAVDREGLSWAAGDAADDDSYLGGNRLYFDARGMPWSEVRRVLDAEAEYVRRIVEAEDPVAMALAIEGEREEARDYGDGDALWNLDLGVAGAVVALSASRCIPFTSCNGGAFSERHHHERHPIVAFKMRPQLSDILISAAADSEAGLTADGDASLYGANIVTIMRFAQQLYARRDDIDAIEIGPDGAGDDEA